MRGLTIGIGSKTDIGIPALDRAVTTQACARRRAAGWPRLPIIADTVPAAAGSPPRGSGRFEEPQTD